VSDHRVTRDDRADGGSRRADERASSINDDSAKAGKAVAIEGRKLRAEIVDDQRPLAGAALCGHDMLVSKSPGFRLMHR